MGWWKADPVSPAPSPRQITHTTTHPQQAPFDPPSECPIDPQTRNIWLQQARQQPQPSAPSRTDTPSKASASTFATVPSEECSSDRVDQSTTNPQISPALPPHLHRPLSHERVVSSIPRAAPDTHTQSPPSNPYANSETNAPNHQSGNWIYPSEAQFFHAVLRKHSPEAILPPDTVPPNQPRPSNATRKTPPNPEADLASTIPTIIPIHNAVNERAWSLIKDWEETFNPAPSPTPKPSPPSNQPSPKRICTGPQLLSFRGLGASTSTMTPRAHWNSLRGYTTPFDRHDWTIRRCDGTEVEYVIDFYQGKDNKADGEKTRRAGQLNFYIDVRPKLNSVEGVRMRVLRGVGLG